VHFSNHAPEKLEYAIKRYAFEAKRHWGILNDRLEGRDWLVGDSYSIVDMAAWGWERAAAFVLGAEGFDAVPNVKRHFAAINARPAAERANALKDRHAFKAEMDDEARRNMFRHLAA
jgi:GST-like protein